MAELKNYRLINQDGVGQVVIKDTAVPLEGITEEQAAFLFKNGSRYVEKVEPVARPARQVQRDLVQ